MPWLLVRTVLCDVGARVEGEQIGRDAQDAAHLQRDGREDHASKNADETPTPRTAPEADRTK